MHPMETTDMNRIKSYHPGQRLSWIILLLCLPITLSAKLTNLDRDGAIRVYIDGHRRFQDYVKTEIPFINYVRDRKVSQVHIIITSQRTGSGGREYTMTFIGQGKFAGLTDTLSYHTKSDDTEEIQRGSYVRVLKLVLIRYVAKHRLAPSSLA